MDEDEFRDQVSQNSMEDGMSTMKEGADKAAGAAKQGAKLMGEKIKSSKMAQRIKKAEEKAKAKAKAVAKETARGTKKVIRGATTVGAGASLAGAGAATQAAGVAMSAAGEALTGASMGFLAAVGETMDAIGKGMQETGKGMIKGGKKVMKHGTKTMKKGAEQIAKAPLAEPGKVPGGSDSVGGIPKPKIPFINRKKRPKKDKKDTAKKLLSLAIQHPGITAIVIGVIVLLLLIIFIVLAVSSSVNRGRNNEGDLGNVPYVVTSMALDKLQIYPDGQGGFTYGFEDENGNALTLDEALDKILETLRKNDSNAYDDLGEDDEERKEFLKLLIQAEVATQYPNLSIRGNGTTTSYMTGTGMSSASSGKDYCVATDQPNAATVLDEDGLRAAINNSELSDQAKQNVLSVIPDLVRYQEQYKVNALFLIAAATVESGCGTNWDLIDPGTYNWLSVKGNENGGYVDRNGTSWNKYSSFAEASESWFGLITGSSYYFRAGKYTVRDIAPTYCDSSWGDSVADRMDKYYQYAGATDQRQIAAVTTSSYSASPSQSQVNLAQWGWLIQNENLNAYYYEHGYGNITYNSYAVNGYITQDGRDYIVVDNGAGLYIGSGVQLKGPNGAMNTFNLDLIKNHGIDTSSIYAGRTMNADAIDKVSQEIFLYKKNEIQSQAAARGITLTDNQIVALVDISYLNGNVNTQINNIARYGANSDQLANTAGFSPCGENETPVTRAQCVWKLYKYGKYEARQQSAYDSAYFGGVPDTASNEGGTSHSGTAKAGQVDSNGVTITDNGNIDFLNYAIDCHKLLREDGFYYNNSGREMPVVKGDSCHYIDCVAYVSMALDCYGLKDWRYYPHQLTVDETINYGKSNLETIYEGNASTINEIPDLQSGDICIMPGHGQIFYGYASNGEPVWLNCGGNASIQEVEGKSGWYATPILYVFRVPNGSGNVYTARASQVLTGNDESVQGNIKIKRIDESGNEVMLGYMDEATFDDMIRQNNPDVMNYYTLKKGSSNNSNSSNGNVSISGNETTEQIWNYLVDSGCTEQGAAALMGNLEHESGCKPVRVQGDYLQPNADQYSQDYTDKVDNGTISKNDFVYNGPGGGGYGLAQWTATNRKDGLYEYAKSKGTSIGDLQTQLEYLVQELSTNPAYLTIWNTLTTTHDMNAACDLVLYRFESPADPDSKVNTRRESAASYFARYNGSRASGSNNSNYNNNNNSNNNNSNNTSSNTATGVIHDTYTFQSGGSMSYYLYVPSDTSSAKPLVVYQHGRTTRDPTWGDRGWAHLATQKNESFDYYALEPISTDDSWNPDKLKELAEHIISRYNIDTSKISLWGFSNGAEYLDANLVSYPNFYSSVVILARGSNPISNTSAYANKKVFIEYGGGDIAYNRISPGQTAKNCNAIYNTLQSAGVDVRIKNQGDQYGHGETLTRAIHDQEVIDFIFDGSGSSSFVSFDDFLFVGDSRYVGIKSELEGFGNNVNVCAVSGSTAAQWNAIIDSGSGSVNNANITLPDNASGVSVMLGTNTCPDNAKEVKDVLNKLHARYPNAHIYYNSVYHVGDNYWTGHPDTQNATYDALNGEIKTFCDANNWATYIDISEGMHDENGYLIDKDGEGTHATGNSKAKLIENIRNKIRSSGNNSSNQSASNQDNAPGDRYSIAVASYDQRTVTSVDSYQYAYTRVISTSSGTMGTGTQFSATPAGYTTTNTTISYKTSYADYQPAVKNHTFYFDFLWAVYITSGDKDLVKKMAEETIDSTLEITIYTDAKTTQNVATTTIQPKIIYKRENTTAYEDHYNGTNTTTTTNKIATSKGCLTLANVWNMEYENNASTYSEFKSKSKEKVREKIEDNDEIMKILREKDRADKLDKEYYMLEEMLEDNEKVSHMLDIFKYYVDIAKVKSKSKAQNTVGNYIDTGLFDLSNLQSNSTIQVLLYTSLNISETDKEMMYKAIEQMTSGFPDNEENTQRKKYIASVILNRALSSRFPDDIEDILKKSGQFPNYSKTVLSNGTYSDSTKAAVDSVIQGGDCSKYSVYFNTPSGADRLGWDTSYSKTLNDGDGTDNSYSYYTTDDITSELKTFEVSVRAGTTLPSETANKIVQWAEAQVGKSTFRNKNAGKNMESKNYCASFVQCAYNEAGLGYLGAGSAKEIPHPNPVQFNSDGTINYSRIPVGAVIVSNGVPVNGVDYGHVCLYVGNGYVIEAGGDKIQKSPIDESFGGKGHNCAPFIGWGFAVEDQNAAYDQLVIKIGGNYPEGWTQNDDETRMATGIEGVYVVNGRQYNVYCQGGNSVWASQSYSMGTFSSSACGATSAAIISSGADPNITPIETGTSCYAYAGQPFGSRTQAVTNCAALTRALSDAGLRSEWKSASKQEVIQHLQTGQPVIVLLHGGRAGNETYGGHYITLLGVNAEGQIFLGDPAREGRNTGYYDASCFDIPSGGVCFVYFD